MDDPGLSMAPLDRPAHLTTCSFDENAHTVYSHIIFYLQDAQVFTGLEEREGLHQCGLGNVVVVHLQDSVTSLQEAISNSEKGREEEIERRQGEKGNRRKSDDEVRRKT